MVDEEHGEVLPEGVVVEIKLWVLAWLASPFVAIAGAALLGLAWQRVRALVDRKGAAGASPRARSGGLMSRV